MAKNFSFNSQKIMNICFGAAIVVLLFVGGGEQSLVKRHQGFYRHSQKSYGEESSHPILSVFKPVSPSPESVSSSRESKEALAAQMQTPSVEPHNQPKHFINGVVFLRPKQNGMSFI